MGRRPCRSRSDGAWRLTVSPNARKGHNQPRHCSLGWRSQESARRFYAVLVKIPGWEQMAVTYAAQAVQQSAFPDAYAQHQSRAEQIVAAISP
jgi:hypothetical protein